MLLGVQPLLVFDGPNKPPFKRGRRTFHNAAAVYVTQAKQLLTLLGIPYHDAPGEAEAECALLQREGIVDAILSEDVDTIMFGCRSIMRSWSSEGTRDHKAPTHVSLYDAEDIQQGKSGLSASGILLVALMNGGDYNPGGIPGCGIKLACEAARAGFGESLCALNSSDTTGLQRWREKLREELRTNESGFFRVKNKRIGIPDEFPTKEILNFYLNPSISSPEKLVRLKERLFWEAPVDIRRLRYFVSEMFDWQNLSGAKKLISVFAEPLLVHQLIRRGKQSPSQSNQDSECIAGPPELVALKTICGKRSVFSTDNTPELQISYVSSEVVGLDLSEEAPGVEGQRNLPARIIQEGGSSTENIDGDDSMSRKRGKSTFDPNKPEKAWVAEALLRAALPTTVIRWEEDQRLAKSRAKAKPAKKGRKAKGGMEYGAMDRYINVTKPFKSSPPSMGATKRVKDPAPQLPRPDEGSPVSSFKRPPESFDVHLPPSTQNPAMGIDQILTPAETRSRFRNSSSEELPEDLWITGSRPVRSKKLPKDKPPSAAEPGHGSRRTKASLVTESSNSLHRSRSPLPPLGHCNANSPDSTPSSQDLPDCSILLKNKTNPSPKSKPIMHSALTTTSSSPPLFQHGFDNPQPESRLRPKRMVALRESLEGAWRETDEASLVGSKVYAWRDVEVVDLTGSADEMMGDETAEALDKKVGDEPGGYQLNGSGAGEDRFMVSTGA
ncbi:MAG: hypothetical protein M1816_004186 [Peltula sp. TS41687]|nr:MAG: hypothetical protein M1816_004186 [Peltula sp. TS41687]